MVGWRRTWNRLVGGEAGAAERDVATLLDHSWCAGGAGCRGGGAGGGQRLGRKAGIVRPPSH